MLEIFQSMQASLDDPQRLHALVVHLPIGAAVFGLLLVLLLVVTGGRAHGLRWGAFAVLAVGAAAAYLASETGTSAEDHMMEVRREMISKTRFGLSPEAQAHLSEHSTYGEYVGWTMAAAALFVALTVISKTGVRSTMLALALAAALANAGLVAYVGHHGGAMVYVHGVGVPGTDDNLPKAAAAPHEHEHEKDGDDAQDAAPTEDEQDAKPASDEPKGNANGRKDSDKKAEEDIGPHPQLGKPEPADGQTVFDE